VQKMMHKDLHKHGAEVHLDAFSWC
jgi:hypothetical protein